MTTLTNEQKNTIIDTAIRTVGAGGHSSISDVIFEVREDCKKLGLTDLEVFNLFLEMKFCKIKVTL